MRMFWAGAFVGAFSAVVVIKITDFIQVKQFEKERKKRMEGYETQIEQQERQRQMESLPEEVLDFPDEELKAVSKSTYNSCLKLYNVLTCKDEELMQRFEASKKQRHTASWNNIYEQMGQPLMLGHTFVWRLDHSFRTYRNYIFTVRFIANVKTPVRRNQYVVKFLRVLLHDTAINYRHKQKALDYLFYLLNGNSSTSKQEEYEYFYECIIDNA